MRNASGYSPIHYAGYLEFDDFVNYLSLRVPNLNTLDPEGLTILSRLVLRRSFGVAEALLGRGASIN